MENRTPYRPGDPKGMTGLLIRILTYGIIIAVCAAIGGGVGSCGPYVLTSGRSSRSHRRMWNFAKDDRVGNIRRRFGIGAAIGGVFGVGFAAYCAIKTRRAEP